jgi:hypothetical protein
MENDLEAILFGFVQATFSGSPVAETTVPNFDDALERLGQFRTVRAETVLTWPGASRLALKELLTDWIIVIRLAEEIGEGYYVPAAYLAGASSTRLPETIVSEILHRSDALIEQYQRRQQD